MSWRSYARRKDTVHKPIVADLEARGFIVIDTSGVGKGAPDAFIYSPSLDLWKAVEFKSDNSVRHKKAGAEGEAISNNKPKKSLRVTVPIVHTLSEALALFGMEL